MTTEHHHTHVYILAITRITMGLIFLWAFLDKTFGLGFATEASKAWIAGGSPTAGFLQYATSGPFAALFQSLAGSAIVDWLFMLGLLGIGVACILGIALRCAGYCGAVLMLLMWLAVLPPENNPLLDKHIVYALLFLVIAYMPEHYFALQERWKHTVCVQKFPFLQ